MKVIEQQLAECKNNHFYMQKLLEKQRNNGELEQIRTECHLCFDNQEYRDMINKFLAGTIYETTK